MLLTILQRSQSSKNLMSSPKLKNTVLNHELCRDPLHNLCAADSKQLEVALLPTASPSYPGCGRAAAGLSQQPSGPFVLVILGLQLDGSQPNLLAVWVCLDSKQRNKTGSYKMRVGMRYLEKRKPLKATVNTSQTFAEWIPGRPARGCFWLQEHPQPATWTWLPSTTGLLLWDSEPQPFGVKPPKTP